MDSNSIPDKPEPTVNEQADATNCFPTTFQLLSNYFPVALLYFSIVRSVALSRGTRTVPAVASAQP